MDGENDEMDKEGCGSACAIERRGLVSASRLQVVLSQLFAKCAAGHAQHRGCAGLIATRSDHRNIQHRLFHALHDHLPQVGRVSTVKIVEISVQARAHAVFERVRGFHGLALVGVASGSQFFDTGVRCVNRALLFEPLVHPLVLLCGGL